MVNYQIKNKIKSELINKINYIIQTMSKDKGTEDDANMIINGVWLGNISVSNDKYFYSKCDVSHVVNVCTIDNVKKYNNVTYNFFPFDDKSCCQKDIEKKYFIIASSVSNIIDNNIKNNVCTLIHCKRGHHRSASIIAYYLMTKCNMSLINSIVNIKKSRPTSFRRINCTLSALINYETDRIYNNFVNDNNIY